MILIFNFYRFLLFNHSFFYLTIHVFTFSSILFRYDAVSRGSKPPGLERLRGILPTAQRRGRLTIWIVENKATTEPTTTRQGQCDREMSVTLSIANSGIEMDVSVFVWFEFSWIEYFSVDNETIEATTEETLKTTRSGKMILDCL